MFCPKCKSEYTDGFYECSSCRIKLVEKLNEQTCNDLDGRKSHEPSLVGMNDTESLNSSGQTESSRYKYSILGIVGFVSILLFIASVLIEWMFSFFKIPNFIEYEGYLLIPLALITSIIDVLKPKRRKLLSIITLIVSGIVVLIFLFGIIMLLMYFNNVHRM